MPQATRRALSGLCIQSFEESLNEDWSNAQSNTGCVRWRYPTRPGPQPGHDTTGAAMPLFMDVHNIEGGVSASDVAGAHQADLAAQDAHGVKYLRYWVDEEAGKIFCLVEAPDAESANTVHREAHGLVADEIYPVSEHT